MTPGVRAGIIGMGFMGQVHARAIRAADGEVVAVALASLARAQTAARRLGGDCRAESVEDLLQAADVDVVHVCTPNHLHSEQALAAIAAGKHVVCEKPLATSQEAAEHLAAAAAAAGVIATVPFVYRFYPAVREARARIALGKVGPLRVIHGSYLQDWLASADDNNWRVDSALGGPSRAFADIGVHWCDLVEFISDHRITRVVARLATAHSDRWAVEANSTGPVNTEDVAAVLFETDRGAVGSVLVSQIALGQKNRLWLSLDGDLASIRFDQENPESLWVGGRTANSLILRGSDAYGPEAARYTGLPAGHPQGYQDSFNAFVADTYQAIRGDTPEGLPSFDDGWRAGALTDAVLKSAKSRSWADVPWAPPPGGRDGRVPLNTTISSRDQLHVPASGRRPWHPVSTFTPSPAARETSTR